MKRFEIKCRNCGSTYDIGSQASSKLDTGSISCFVCGDNISIYDGFLSYYPFLKQRKEQHIKFDPNFTMDDTESFDRESNG